MQEKYKDKGPNFKCTVNSRINQIYIWMLEQWSLKMDHSMEQLIKVH